MLGTSNWHGRCNILGKPGNGRTAQGESIMNTIRLAASIVLGLVASTSAFAAEPDVAVSAPIPVATTAAAPVPTRKVLYSFKSEQAGSRINRFRCETRKTWQALGLNIESQSNRR
jgi:hypothetical protein